MTSKAFKVSISAGFVFVTSHTAVAVPLVISNGRMPVTSPLITAVVVWPRGAQAPAPALSVLTSTAVEGEIVRVFAEVVTNSFTPGGIWEKRAINLVPCSASPALFKPSVAGYCGLKNPVSVLKTTPGISCADGVAGSEPLDRVLNTI